MGWGGAIAILCFFCHPSLAQEPSPEANANSEANPDGNPAVVRSPAQPPGLCNMSQRDLSGRWVDDGTGAMVPLVHICDVVHEVDEVDEAPDLTAEDKRFWTAFTAAASGETLSFATTLDPDAVGSYGQAICTSLMEGESMDNIRRIQAEGDLPAGFDAAVNVAAIHVYCPDYAAAIGR